MTSEPVVENPPVDEHPLTALLNHETRSNPYPVLAGMRESGPLVTANDSVVVVGDYANCSRLMRDRSMGSDTSSSRMLQDVMVNAEDRAAASIFFMDPPGHTRQRKLIAKSFTPRITSKFGSRIGSSVDDLFAKFSGRGHFDAVNELAYPLSMGIICDLFDIPEADRGMLKEWSDELALSTEVPTLAAGIGLSQVFSQEELSRFGGTAFAAHGYFADLIHRRRRNPGDDLVSSLLSSEDQGERLTRFEVTSVLITLFIAAHESTTNLISNGILALSRNPDQFALLRRDPTVAPALVDEVLRYDPPVHLAARIALSPNRIGDLDIEPGTVIFLLLAAANRDPAEFPEPDKFDIKRVSKSVSLAFGAGAHFCIGSSLAKLEAEIALSAFAERLTEPEVDEDSLAYRRHVVVRGLERMTVRFRP